MLFRLKAVIPTHQYSNLQPEWEVEADTFEEAQAIAEAQMLPFWNKYVESDKKLNDSDRKLVDCFVGGQVYYSEISHTYSNEAGDIYLSGSQYAQQFKKPFNKQAIAEATAKKFDVDPSEIIDFWDHRSKTSTDFGTAIHTAIEFYGKYEALAEVLGKNSVHDHPVIKNAVEGFLELAGRGEAVYEAMVVNHERKHAGQIDRLVILGDKHGKIQDIKTGAVMKPDDLKSYHKQLEFYDEIMKSAGWKMEPHEIYHYNGDWKLYE